ncbi:DUF3795 domain-containing protein [Herbivorax sp. ANBcel31]|uniref:DUF3795 domain-containing protein n=1 Tax=Herbivorax sp. ANBcel31 TaxID=3069754 RepID=UPI0027ADB305|nr:DUF3795 domain-containing protein [Herbivorax sp. ANBcel31]MDQ2086869.1 DUF3795 domain-containing protein [Herbivorax sp. ANBcel31]
MLDKKDLVAPCGLDCFNCGAYEKNISDIVRQKLSTISGKKPDDVACKGCRVTKGKDLPLVDCCATYQCSLKQKIDFCYECGNFPCSKLAPCASNADFVPQNMKIYNLCRMKKVGIEKWIEETKTIRELYSKGEYVPGCGPILKK